MPRRRRQTEPTAIARVAMIVSYVLDAVGLALAAAAEFVLHNTAGALATDHLASEAPMLMALGGLALLGAVAAGIASVSQQPRRMSTRVALVVAGLALAGLVLASIPVA
jgi:hypothetical protein